MGFSIFLFTWAENEVDRLLWLHTFKSLYKLCTNLTQPICGIVKNVDFAHIRTLEKMLKYSKEKWNCSVLIRTSEKSFYKCKHTELHNSLINQSQHTNKTNYNWLYAEQWKQWLFHFKSIKFISFYKEFKTRLKTPKGKKDIDTITGFGVWNITFVYTSCATLRQLFTLQKPQVPICTVKSNDYFLRMAEDHKS